MKKVQIAIAAVASVVGVVGALVTPAQARRAPTVQVRHAGQPNRFLDLAQKGTSWDCDGTPTVCYYLDNNGDGIYETASTDQGQIQE